MTRLIIAAVVVGMMAGCMDGTLDVACEPGDRRICREYHSNGRNGFCTAWKHCDEPEAPKP